MIVFRINRLLRNLYVGIILTVAARARAPIMSLT
jgi:hypothetical protein